MGRVGPGNWLRGPLGGVVRVTAVSLAFVALLVWLRGDALLSPLAFNPDEAELLADGKRAMLSLVPYRDYTTPTFLFVWPLALGLLGKLGFALTLPTAHLLSGIVYLSLIVAGWYMLSRYVHWLYALACITPAAVVLFVGKAATGERWINTDFFSLGTELLPIAFLTGALLLVHTGNPLRWRPRLALAALLIGSSVLAKPQAFPLSLGVLVASVAAVSAQEGFALADAGTEARRNLRGVATWAVVFGLRACDRRARLDDVGAYVACVLPGARVVRSRLRVPAIDGRQSGLWSRHRVQSASPRSRVRSSQFHSHTSSFLPPATTVSGRCSSPSAWPSGRRRRGLVVLVGVTLTGLVAAFVSYPVYTHYLNFVYAGCVFAAVSSCAVLGPRSPRQVTTRSGWYRIGSVIAVAALIGVAVRRRRHGHHQGAAGQGIVERAVRSGQGCTGRGDRTGVGRDPHAMPVRREGRGVGLGVRALQLQRLDSGEPVRQPVGPVTCREDRDLPPADGAGDLLSTAAVCGGGDRPGLLRRVRPRQAHRQIAARRRRSAGPVLHGAHGRADPGGPSALLRPARCLQDKLDARLKPGAGYPLAAIKPWTYPIACRRPSVG